MDSDYEKSTTDLYFFPGRVIGSKQDSRSKLESQRAGERVRVKENHEPDVDNAWVSLKAAVSLASPGNPGS